MVYKKESKDSVKKAITALVIVLMILPVMTAFMPVQAATGQPKLAAVDNVSSPGSIQIASSNVTVIAGRADVTKVDNTNPLFSPAFLAIIFKDPISSLVTFSGAQFRLYMSKNGLSQLNTTEDVPFGPTFNVVDLDGTYKQVGTTGYYIGVPPPLPSYSIVVGPIPVNISKDYKFIKVFDGSTTAVAVAAQQVIVQEGLVVEPSGGAAGRPVTIRGGGFKANIAVNINFTFGSTVGVLVSGVNTGSGFFSVSARMVDTKQNWGPGVVPPPPTNVPSTVITLKAVNASKPSQEFASATFTETARAFTQLRDLTTEVNAKDHLNNEFTPPNFAGNNTLKLAVSINDTVRVAGRWFFANDKVEIWIGASKLAEFTTDAAGAFNGTFTVPVLPQGANTVRVLSPASGAHFRFTLDVQPTLLLTPSRGPVGTLVTASAFGFPANSRIFLYWFEKSQAENKWYWLVNATTGSDGQFNVTVRFNVPRAYGGSHSVAAVSQYLGLTNTTANVNAAKVATRSFTVTPSLSFVISSSQTEISNNGQLLKVSANGLDPNKVYSVIIDSSVLGYVQSNGTGDAIISFVAAGFRPGLHYIAVNVSGPGSFDLAFATFVVTTAGDLVTGEVLNKLSGNLTSISQGLATIQTSLGTIQANVAQLLSALAALNATITSIRADVVAIKTSVGTLITKTDDLAALLRSVDAKIVSVSGSIATLATDVGNLRAELAALGTVLNATGGRLVEVITAIGTIRGEVVNVRNGVATIQTSLGTIQADLSTIKGDISSLKASVSDLGNRVNGVNSNVNTVNANVTNALYLIVAVLVVALLSLVLTFLLRRR